MQQSNANISCWNNWALSRSSILTWSNSFKPGGHSDGSWHTQPGFLSASSLHIFPRLQGKLSHGSRRKDKHCNDLWPILCLNFKTRNHYLPGLVVWFYFNCVITGNQRAITTTCHPLHSFPIRVCTMIKFNLISIIHSLSPQSCVLVMTVKQRDAIHAEVFAKWSSQQIPLWGCWDSALVSMVTNQQGHLGDHWERTWNLGRDPLWLLSALDSFLLKDPGKVHRKHKNTVTWELRERVATTY